MLAGRAEECRQLRLLLEDARSGRASALLLHGEPGIGKTALLRWTAEQASDFLVLSCRGEQAASTPAGALRQLLGPVLERRGQLPPRQSEALAAALHLGPASAGDRFSVAAAVLSLLALAAERRPLLLLVDDLHWLDAATSDALLFTVRRLQAERIGVVLAGRDEGRRPSGVPERLVQGLSGEEVSQLLSRAGERERPPVALAEMVRLTRGNPLALLELPGPDGTSAPERPLPVGARLEQAFRERVAHLPGRSREALLLVATAGESSADALGAALRLRGLEVCDLDAAEAVGLVRMEAGEVAFTHPMMRSAAYQAASAAGRRSAHAALADALAGRGGPGAAERRARHLAAAADGPDPDVAAALASVAEAAAGRHDHAAALDLHERAAALEPEAARATRQLLAAAYATMPSGRVDEVDRLVDAVLDRSDDPAARSEAQHVRCRVDMWRGRPVAARDLLLQVASERQGADPVSAAVMLAHSALVSAMLGDQPSATTCVERARALLGDLPDEWTMPVLLLHAFIDALGGRVRSARELLTRSAPHLEATDPLGSDQLLLVAGLAHLSLDELAPAQRWIDRAVSAARSAGAVGLLPFQLTWSSRLSWLSGDANAAYAAAHEAVSLAEETGWRTERPNALIALALVEAAWGRAAQCRVHCAEAEGLAASTGAEIVSAHAAVVLGLLELGEGRPARAAVHLRSVAEFAGARGVGDPVLLPWAGDLAEAYARSGDPVRAGAVLEQLQEEADRTGRPTERAVAARCRALLTAGERADDLFGQALALHAQGARPFEEARTALCLGEHLRRTGRAAEARGPLESALRVFERLGARGWATRVHGQLDGRARAGPAAPAPVPASQALSAQELQVALVVARGASNAEAAAELFLSRKTIEFHLSNAYRKLGLRSRSQLLHALSRPVPG